MVFELRIDGGAIVGPSSRAPLGPLDVVLPLFAPGSVGAAVAMGVVGAALVAVVAFEWRESQSMDR